MRTIGVLGGLGPQATMDFEVRFHRVAQRRIPQFQNSGYPPLVVYYHRRPPFVMGPGNAPASPLHAEPDLLTAAQWLGARADLLVIPANAPHAVQDQIERAAGRKVLSMIDVTLDDVRRRGWKSVGVMGFGDPKVPVYTDRLREQNVAYHIIDEELQPELDKAIFSVMEGRTTPESTTVAQRALAMLRDQAVDGIILGCTELPLLLADDAGSDALANPVQLLAEAAVEQALA